MSDMRLTVSAPDSGGRVCSDLLGGLSGCSQRIVVGYAWLVQALNDVAQEGADLATAARNPVRHRGRQWTGQTRLMLRVRVPAPFVPSGSGFPSKRLSRVANRPTVLRPAGSESRFIPETPPARAVGASFDAAGRIRVPRFPHTVGTKGAGGARSAPGR
ncbi:hypothetical protein GCM10028864_65320 [Microlunatus parietis]